MVVSVIRRLGSYAAGVALALLGGVLIVMGLAGIAGWLLALT